METLIQQIINGLVCQSARAAPGAALAQWDSSGLAGFPDRGGLAGCE